MKKSLAILTPFLVALILRLLLLPLPAFPIDMNDWIAWANHILKVGPGQFYTTAWSDYLPGYLYVLWVLGFIHQIIPQIPYEMIMKIPAILADLGLGFLIFRLVKKEARSIKLAILSAGFFLFNPLVLFNSSVWGQIDSVFSLLLFLGIYFLVKKRGSLAFLFLALAFLIKPPVILFLPLFFLWLKKGIREILTGGAVFLAAIFFLSWPFFIQEPVFGLPKLLAQSAGTYPYTSIFALNFWGIFGTWKPDSGLFLNITYKDWGLILLGLGGILVLLLSGRQKKRLNYYLFASIMVLTYFMLPTRVHERWLYAFFPLFLVPAALSKNLKPWLVYFLFSILHFLNLYYVYTYYQLYFKPNFFQINWLMRFIEKNFSLLSSLAVLLYGSLLFYVLKLRRNEKI